MTEAEEQRKGRACGENGGLCTLKHKKDVLGRGGGRQLSSWRALGSKLRAADAGAATLRCFGGRPTPNWSSAANWCRAEAGGPAEALSMWR